MEHTLHFRSSVVAACTLCLASCAASPGDATAPTAETVDTSPQPAPSVDASPPPSAEIATAEPPPSEAPPVEAPPYPEDAIRRGQNEASKACTNLVYKHGCDQTRTGKVTVRVSLRDDGTVLSAHVGTNDIKTDPKLVEDCLLDAVEKFHFDPPGSNASSFAIKFVLGDKC